jgi:hypothetical protein
MCFKIRDYFLILAYGAICTTPYAALSTSAAQEWMKSPTRWT